MLQISNNDTNKDLALSNIRHSPLDLTAAKTNEAFQTQLKLITDTYAGWTDRLSGQLNIVLGNFYKIPIDEFEMLLSHVLVEQIDYEFIDDPVLVDENTWERSKLEKYLCSCAFILQLDNPHLQPLNLLDPVAPNLKQLLPWFVSQNISIESPFRGLIKTITTHDYAIEVLDLFYPDDGDLNVPPTPRAQGISLIFELSLTKSNYACAVERHAQKREIREICSITNYLSEASEYAATILETERHKQEKLYLERKQQTEREMAEIANRTSQQITQIVQVGQQYAENQLTGINQEFSLKTGSMQNDIDTNKAIFVAALNTLSSRVNAGEIRSRWLEQQNSLNQSEIERLKAEAQQRALEISNLKKNK